MQNQKSINCYLGSNSTNTVKNSTAYAGFKSCQIIRQKCPYHFTVGNLCAGPISFGVEIPIDHITVYSGEATNCIGVTNAYSNSEWPIYSIDCCTTDLCNKPFGKFEVESKKAKLEQVLKKEEDVTNEYNSLESNHSHKMKMSVILLLVSLCLVGL